jgi:hypothetical protein
VCRQDGQIFLDKRHGGLQDRPQRKIAMNFKTDLAPQILAAVRKSAGRQLVSMTVPGRGPGGGGGSPPEDLLVWVVFLACLVCSAVGVIFSFVLLVPKIGGIKMWGVALLIAIVMLGISYGAKYANDDARKKFTPVDAIQYVSQGFLWPSTWPALAAFLGVQPIGPPQTSWLFNLSKSALALLAMLVW